MPQIEQRKREKESNPAFREMIYKKKRFWIERRYDL